ncbi:GGDEF domain-containing protein [Aquabacterium sp.]|uniref:GGDEF domain-containing protein n=1 Tax=Aquabacterium sp. TaxID=1872578 RepID=UPI0025BB3832|nr:GGDEF domain-containing protein [Aquabacterium sp.]
MKHAKRPQRESPARHTSVLLAPFHRLGDAVLGTDRATRARTRAILLCAVMYAICCAAASLSAELGLMRAFAPTLLEATCVPAYLVIYALVRSGRTQKLSDPALMVPQNVFALLAIAFAYTAVGPNDRGAVLVLIALVVVFGMYTHTPRQSAAIGVMAMLLLGGSMVVLSRWDPVYYPPARELIRFELMAGTMPALILSGFQLASWRTRLSTQRRELQEALDQVHQLATRDALTGLLNRRAMQDLLDEQLRRFERHGEHFALALIDLDHFKRINDQHGHRTGDDALKAFAQAATTCLRETDTVARWGGEEFLVLMPHTGAHKATTALQRLRSMLSETTVGATEAGIRLGFSSGVAVHEVATPLTQTLERADRALYQAKEAGRGRDVRAPSLRAV